MTQLFGIRVIKLASIRLSASNALALAYVAFPTVQFQRKGSPSYLQFGLAESSFRCAARRAADLTIWVKIVDELPSQLPHRGIHVSPTLHDKPSVLAIRRCRYMQGPSCQNGERRFRQCGDVMRMSPKTGFFDHPVGDSRFNLSLTASSTTTAASFSPFASHAFSQSQ